jgi:hypothetical protein
MRLIALLATIGLTLVSSNATESSQSGVAPAQAAKADAKEKAWQIKVGAAAEDGTRSVSATLRADAPITRGADRVTPRLVLRYRAGQAAAFVVFETYLGSGELPATLTFGAQSPEAQTWILSSDGQTAFVPGDAFAFIDRLKQVETFTVRVAPRKGDPVTVSFSPRETDLVLKALISATMKYGG